MAFMYYNSKIKINYFPTISEEYDRIVLNIAGSLQ